MFGLTTINKSKLAKMHEELEVSISICDRFSKDNQKCIEKLHNTEKELDEVLAELNQLKHDHAELKKITKEQNISNSVSIVMDDTMTKFTPVIRHKPNVFEVLFQSGYLNDSQNNKEAIELALLTISSEVLTQLLDEFVEPFREE
ncbi:hypothetical protein [Alishewanella phage vB_AspM_Slicko01]|nr:hypothetical protein [Alishewanella phage vB_AspM_Slicko01]